MAKKPEQEAFEGMQQDKIAVIESAIKKADTKREIIGGLKDELKNAEFKVKEAMTLHANSLSKEKNKNGEDVLVYRRGDFRATLERKEKLLYDVTSESSKGAEDAE